METKVNRQDNEKRDTFFQKNLECGNLGVKKF